MKRKATKAELAHLAAVKRLPCLACRKQWRAQPSITEGHHVLSGGKRRGHMYVVPLCRWHHQSELSLGFTKDAMTVVYGPSLANGSKPFHEAFGSDLELLAETEQLLAKQSVEAA
jgi:hypothetical protein